ncbi:cytochrome ubiquinol oxidase subunit I [Vreelandella populi]|uniref:Cytochrome ubiquinol oxidase subunit I n=1 Tax=Vreelandella populi TaxID=2498858 RepID=A0A3S0WQB0_9GAMM|nr:cytochrome ubiquinol oxidase subunit I [Halomonas populi]RUR40676.1 cytochrome ubiquinol oxidase subunit I [Halomonas populi]RUR49182.1 cytochrome ubiquinol oxidase subunit I [Halomonas populi]RUR55673.1 cytochrome ubiquinol oxidase subunit I [Halomonas populi]
MELDPLVLSRIQFAFVVSFHAIFPVFTIGLASYIALLQGLFFKTQNPAWDRLALFWTKVFAVVFGMGVVSGVVMSFQFGTNWSNFSLAASNFIGPVLSYEVVTAFFLEAAFLGILLFGRGKVPQGIHLMAATIVAIGTFISAFWILSANSWMHTPAGVELIDNRFHVTSWREAIFNPSFPYRFSHMAIASFITGGFVVAGVSAWFLLRGRDPEANRRALSMCLWLLLFLTPLQAVVGDFHGVNTLEYQPTKVAAIEGHWETATNVPLLLFALPDQEAQENRFAVGIPNLASLILTHSIDGEIPGISEAPPEEQPPVMIVFWAFRVMVGIGLLMIATAFTGLILRRKDRIYENRLFLKTLVGMISLPFIAVLAGWIVTESGRAPWLVYGIMSHADGITPSLTGWMALFTLIGYVLVYAVVFYAGVYYLTRVVRNGMLPAHEHASVDRDADRPKRPLSAAHTPFDDDVDPVRS